MPRRELAVADAAFGTGVLAAEEALGPRHGHGRRGGAVEYLQQARAPLQRGLDGIRETRPCFRGGYQPVHDQLDTVIAPLVKFDGFRDVKNGAIDARAHEPLALDAGEHVAKLTFATAHQRRQEHELRPFAQIENLLDDLAGGLRRDRAPATVAMRLADVRE